MGDRYWLVTGDAGAWSTTGVAGGVSCSGIVPSFGAPDSMKEERGERYAALSRLPSVVDWTGRGGKGRSARVRVRGREWR